MSTKHQGPPHEIQALDTYIALMRAAATITQRAHRHLARVDLTIGQFGVLEALTHIGPLRQHELARKVLCSAGNLSIVLNNLEKRGLVRREDDRHDGRCTLVHATDEARALIAEVFPQHADGLANEFAVLTSAEQDTLKSLCHRLGTQSDDGPPPCSQG